MPSVAPRRELLDVLLRGGILRRSKEQPIVSPDGSSARWMLDSLGFSMSARGAELSALCLLDALKGFEGRQLATYGTTGIPLMQACITQSRGRYHGLIVRKERKAHGSLKLVEGRIDPSEPVIVVDDSIASGHSVRACVDALRAHGLHVEGAVCLVSFGYDGVSLLQQELGIKVVPVFDVWNDVTPRMPDEQAVHVNPTKAHAPFAPSTRRAREGLHPATLARDVVAEVLRSGKLLQPPKRLEGTWDARGGAWVSLRRRDDVHDRRARNGQWNFPGERQPPAPEAVVLAAGVTARDLLQKHPKDAARVLSECAIAVTFFGELEKCTPGELDQRRYGIVVRSDARPYVMGGALPRMPGIANDWQQLRHAWKKNAQLYALEPFTLYRHEVTKAVEPGETWQPTGAPLDEAPWEEVQQNVAPYLRAAAAAVQREPGRPPPPLPADVDQVLLSVWRNGELQGCQGMRADALDLPALADAVETDPRFDAKNAGAPTVGLSFLCRPLHMGEADPDWVIQPTRFGHDALAVEQGSREAMLLPHACVTHDLDARGWIDALIDKAGITRPPYRWTRWASTTWLIDERGIRRLADGLPERTSQDRATRELLEAYLMQHHTERGMPLFSYSPFANHLTHELHPARLAHSAWVKARCGRRRQALDDLRRVKSKGISELAFVALTQLELGARADVKPLLAAIGPHGRIEGDDQDYAPGQVLYALARAGKPHEAALAYYRRKFRQDHAWGSAAWLMLAFAESGHDDFAFEIADFVLTYQSQREGCWWNDHQPDAPGAIAAVYLEGLAGGPLKKASGARRKRYLVAAERAMRFLDRLTYLPCDAALLPNPDWALGGVRTSLTAGEVRLDFVQHALSAMLWLDEERRR